MNKTGIEWCDLSWNPVTGCNHRCPYCYARKIAERFKGSKAWPNGFIPTYHLPRLNEPRNVKKPNTIFVCSMADLFGEWVPDEWISSVMRFCNLAPQHTYIFLTKNPKRYLTIPGNFLTQKNFWFGTTITDERDMGDRLHWIKRFPRETNTFISFEPLLGEIRKPDLVGIAGIIIGAQTNPTIDPGYPAIKNIFDAARDDGVRMFCKDSLRYYLPDDEFYRDLCWPLRKCGGQSRPFGMVGARGDASASPAGSVLEDYRKEVP